MVLAANDPGAAFHRADGFERRSTGETVTGGDTYRARLRAPPGIDI